MRLKKCLTGIILVAALAPAANSEIINTEPIKPAVESQDNTRYVCPKTKYIDCMPPIREEKRVMCSKEYIRWTETHCQGIKFVY